MLHSGHVTAKLLIDNTLTVRKAHSLVGVKLSYRLSCGQCETSRLSRLLIVDRTYAERTYQIKVSSALDGARTVGFPPFQSINGDRNEHDSLSFHGSQTIPFKSYCSPQTGVVAPLSAAEKKKGTHRSVSS